MRKRQCIERHCYETLAPTNNSKAEETINMLSDFIKSNYVISIALSGKYGAGKTSIIKTFFTKKENKRYKPLYVSLGMLGIKNGEKIAKPEVFCQEIEKSIIQQIIYKEKPSKLLDSTIKRIEKVPNCFIFGVAILLIISIAILILNLYGVNIGDKIKDIIDWIKNIKEFNIPVICKILAYMSITMLTLVIISIISIILSKILKKLAIKSYKFKLPNTELEINEVNEESLISKYMDELVYFFSKTDYDIIVIEDLDRFLEIEEIRDKILIMFQELKELSIILNSSKQVKRKIKFIYAVRDDLFDDAEERTKFFDAIVPVIPVMSNFNSYAELEKRMKTEKIHDDVLQDISIHINDYRVIKNLCNEYFLYKEELKNPGTTNKNIFSMIALKNLKPKLYEELLNNNGQIYQLIKNRSELYKILKSKIEKEIEDNKEKITQIEKEKVKNLKELKCIAIASLSGKSTGLYNNTAIEKEVFLKDTITLEYIKNNELYIRESNGYCFKEYDIFEYFGDKSEFVKRAELIQNKENNMIEKLKNANIQGIQEIKKIEELSLQEVIKRINDKEVINSILKNQNNIDKETIIDEFVLMLVSNGYVNEDYKNYIFKFEQTDKLNSQDYTYISNVRQSLITDYNYGITNPEEVINQLSLKYFGKKEILNNDILEKLLNSNLAVYKEKLSRMINILLSYNDDNNKFIFEFLQYTKKQLLFLKTLYDVNNNYFRELIIYNLENEEKKENLEYYMKVLLENPEILQNDETNKFIKQFVENKSDFESWIDLSDSVKDSLILLKVKFNTLEDQIDTKLIEFIYEKELYVINDNIVSKIFKINGYNKEEFNEKNLTHIMNDEKLKKLKNYINRESEEYINECYLKTNNMKNELEDIYICLNEWNADNKSKIIENMSGQIENIEIIKNIEYDECILNNNKLKPTWGNIYNIYLRNDENISDILIKYIEENLESILKDETINNMQEKETHVFFEKIIRNNYIGYKSYEKLVKKIKFVKLEKIENEEIEDNRLQVLVENNVIEISPQNFEIINNTIPAVLDIYIKNNIDNFIGYINEYKLDEFSIETIIKSEIIKPRYKTIILEKIDLNLINLETMKYIILNYKINNISRLTKQLKERIITSKIESEYKVRFLNKEFYKDISQEDVKYYLSIMPEPFNWLGNYTIKSKTFGINNDKENLELLENIKSKGLNFNFRLSKTNKKLIINNRKLR